MSGSWLVTGATGYLGGHLGRELDRRGMPWVAMVRRRDRAARLPAGARIVEGDVRDAEACRRAASGCEVVVHLAAAADVSDARVNREVNVGGVANVVAACRDASVRRLVFVSSTCAGRALRDAYGETKLQGEALVRASGQAFTILRPTMVYGPGSKEWETFVGAVRTLPLVPIVGSGRNVVQPVYVGDAVAALLAVAGAGPCESRTYDLAGPAPVSFDDLVQAVAAELGLGRRRIVHLPAAPVLLAARLLGRLATHVPLTVDQVLAFLQNTEVDVQPLRADVGLDPVPLAAGLALALSGSRP